MQADHLERHCPRLGGAVTFAYCRTGGSDGKACFKILDCWWELFDVASYLKSQLPPEEFAALQNAMPPSKVSSLIDLIAQARRNAGSNE